LRLDKSAICNHPSTTLVLLLLSNVEFPKQEYCPVIRTQKELRLKAMTFCLPLPTGLSLTASLPLAKPPRAKPSLFYTGGSRAPSVDIQAAQRLLDKQPQTRLLEVCLLLGLHGPLMADARFGGAWSAKTDHCKSHNTLFRHRQISHGDKGSPPVFYCRPDCWRGWSALNR
jgi:hypothetical protein